MRLPAVPAVFDFQPQVMATTVISVFARTYAEMRRRIRKPPLYPPELRAQVPSVSRLISATARPSFHNHNYLRIAADLHAGRQPRLTVSAEGGGTVKQVRNHYLTFQAQKLGVGDVAVRARRGSGGSRSAPRRVPPAVRLSKPADESRPVRGGGRSAHPSAGKWATGGTRRPGPGRSWRWSSRGRPCSQGRRRPARNRPSVGSQA